MNKFNPLLQHEHALIRQSFLSFFGGYAQQRPDAFVSFNRLLNAHNFDRIIEIGTHTGGLSLQFALYALLSRTQVVCDDPSEPALFVNRTHHRSLKSFTTYDIAIRDKSIIQILRAMGANFVQADTLNDPKTIETIRAQIAAPGTTLLLCDGGNKHKEFELYAPALKPGDFIMGHDWAYDEAAFECNKRDGVWRGWELKWQTGEGDQNFGIKDICERNGLKRVYAEEFDPVVWVCCVKE